MNRSLRWLACGLCVACGASGEPAGSAGSGGQAGMTASAGIGGTSIGGTGSGGPSVAGSNNPLAGTGGQAGATAGADTGGDPGESAGSPPNSNDGGSRPVVITGLEKTDPYPASVYPQENPYSAEKALLGKILFWEEQLSSRDTHACGTCHRPGAGGSDPRSVSSVSLGAGHNGIFGDADDARGSQGVVRCDSAGAPKADPVYGLNVQVTPRKAPSALDAGLFDTLFWDGRATTTFINPVTGEVAIESGGALESQAAGPPVSSVEMSCEGYDWTAIESKLAGAKPLKLTRQIPAAMAQAISEHPTYPSLFEWVYKTPGVTAERILFAIATYERELRSDQTPWDRFNAGDSDALTPGQQAGLAVFNVKARCAKCHVPPRFSDNRFHNIGAQASELDPGRSSISGDPADIGKMKTAGLRNVGLRAASGLLHYGTGNAATLRSVLDVYRQGGVEHDHTDPDILPMNVPDYEFEQLLDFLQNGLTDPRAAAELPPFDRPRLASEP